MEAQKATGFKWTFQRLGGLDQVVLRGAEDLCRIRELDPKLWVALSCPASGLQFDARTLALIDTDKDGRIRIPEIIEAVEWVCARLKDPGTIKDGADSLPLDAIDDTTDEGRRLVLTGRAILRNLGKADTSGLAQDDVVRAAAHVSEQMFNGDGVLPPLPGLEPDIQQFIRDAMAVTGGVEDSGGEMGINREIAAAFVQTLRNWLAWRESVNEASNPLGEATPEAWDLLGELKDKIDDYFLRCELIAYAPASQNALSVYEKQLLSVDNGLLDAKTLAELPLSRVGPDRPLDMRSGINPAWRAKTERLAEITAPFLPTPGSLTRDDWLHLQERFTPYARALALKPEAAAVAVDAPPTAGVDKLGEERIKEILEGDLQERFGKLADEDADVPAAAADITRVERLVLYHRHLYRLLLNFVNFEEFYSLQRAAAFQSGKLFIDGRSCSLCMPADKVDEHSALAANSQLYLLYCECARGRKSGEKYPERKTGIVAAITAGDSDLLMRNRNGVYVDNKGDDWDATVVKIVSNPIGIWQAVWNPYKKFGSMLADQIGKFASEKQTGLMASAGQKLNEMTAAATTPQAAAPRFDIGRNVGIFAAVGLALGAIGTAVGSIAGALFRMSWWQFPLLIGGLFAFISGPSVIMAWLKLRQRTLGPLLEASGWAINGRVLINYTVSRRLTATAALPPNSRRSRKDPLSIARRWRMFAFIGALLLGGAGVLLWLHYREPEPVVPATSAAPHIAAGMDESLWNQLVEAFKKELDPPPAAPSPEAPSTSPPVLPSAATAPEIPVASAVPEEAPVPAEPAATP